MENIYEDNKLSKFIKNNTNLKVGQDVYLILLDEIYDLHSSKYKIYKDRLNGINIEKNIIHLELMLDIIMNSDENILIFSSLEKAKYAFEKIKSNLANELENKLDSITFFRPDSETILEDTKLNKKNKKLKNIFDNILNVGHDIYIYNPENNKSNSYNINSISLMEDNTLIDISFKDKNNENIYKAKADVIENKIYFNDKEFLFFRNSEDLFQHINESKELILKL